MTSRFAVLLFAAIAVVAQPSSIDVSGAPMAIQILAQSPADTTTDLQVICLFQSSAENTLHGSLLETDERLKGLLQRMRSPERFRGELGETLLLNPPRGSLGARRLLIVGLGDSENFSPQRMQLVGEIVYHEANRLGVARPFFAPTILDGGVGKYTTGEVAEQVIRGVLRAAATEKTLREAKAAGSPVVTSLVYLAGEKNVKSTREGIERAIGKGAGN